MFFIINMMFFRNTSKSRVLSFNSLSLAKMHCFDIRLKIFHFLNIRYWINWRASDTNHKWFIKLIKYCDAICKTSKTKVYLEIEAVKYRFCDRVNTEDGFFLSRVQYDLFLLKIPYFAGLIICDCGSNTLLGAKSFHE
jgi:hypothetical protein